MTDSNCDNHSVSNAASINVTDPYKDTNPGLISLLAYPLSISG